MNWNMMEQLWAWLGTPEGARAAGHSADGRRYEQPWRAAAGRYGEKMVRDHGWIQIFAQAAPRSLNDCFTELHLLDRLTAQQRYSLEQLAKEFATPAQRSREAARHEGLALVSGAVATANPQRLFILGKPGAGKTTFLKRVVTACARGALQGVERVPIFVSLKELVDSGLPVRAFIEREFDSCQIEALAEFVTRLLASGKALICFDGLDEVPQGDRQQARLVHALQEFMRHYHHNQYLITCRLAADEAAFPGFTYLEMADFTPAQVESFVGKWFAGEAAMRDRFLAELRKPEHRGLEELTQIPLLLTLLCLAFDATGTFPARRVEIYEEALEALLKKWDGSRRIERDEIYRNLSLGHKRHLFAELAYRTFVDGNYFVPRRTLAAQIVEYLRLIPPQAEREAIDGEAVLRAIEAQHGILVERARHIYSFAHLTFQEYYTAAYIADHTEYGTLRHLVQDHGGDPRWREVLRLVASLRPRADAMFEAWLDHLDRIVAGNAALAGFLAWVEEQGQGENTSTVERANLIYHGFAILPLLLFAARHNNYDSLYAIERVKYMLDQSRHIRFNRMGSAVVEDGYDYNIVSIDLALSRWLLRYEVRQKHHHRSGTPLGVAFDLICSAGANIVHSNLDIDLLPAYVFNLALDIIVDDKTYFAGLRFVAAVLLLSHLMCVVDSTGFKADLYFIARHFYCCALDIKSSTTYALLAALDSYPLPPPDATPAAWQTFADQIEALLRTHCDLPPEAILEEEALATLEHYLQHVTHLLACLEVATVTDKAAIEARLLRAPRAAGGGR